MSQAINFRRRDSNASSNNNSGSTGGASSSLTNNNSLKNDLGLSPRWRASPMSFKMGSLIGSLGTRLYPAPGCSPTPALDSQDFKMGSVSGSYESRLLQALSTSHQTVNPDDGCSNYTCCGLPLTDLHALLDHFEESHVYVLDHPAMSSPHQQPLDPLSSATSATGGVAIPVPTGGPSGAGYEDMQMNNMEMDEADMDASNTDSPLLGSGGSSSATSSQNSSPHMGSQAALTAAANAAATSTSIYPYYADLRNLMANAAATGVPTAASSGSASGGIMETAPLPVSAPASNLSVQLAQMQQQCIPPSLLFSPAGSPGSSRRQSMTAAAESESAAAAAKNDAKATGAEAAKKSAATPIPPKPDADEDSDEEIYEASEEVKAEVAALLADVKLDPDVKVVSGPGIVHPGPPPPTQATTSFSKPFKCPTPNCNKSYKQANGLKYHMTHGQCCFLPKDPALDGLDDAEKDKVERPFGCGVGGCERRYKNMNGLRYHYQHSGAHGAVGLALLAAGTHSVQIAAHNAAIGRSAAKLAAQQRAQSVVSNISTSSSTMPQSPGGAAPPKSPVNASASRPGGVATVKGAAGASNTATHSRTPSGSSTPGAASGVRRLSNATSPVRSNTLPARPGQAPTATTYAQSTYYASQPGYPYISQPGAGYPYLPTSTAAQYANRGPVFPPTSTPGASGMTGAIAAMAGAFGSTTATAGLGAPFTYPAAPASATTASTTSQPQRPHQLMRTNSHGAGAAPVVATSAVTAVVSSGSSPRASAVMDVDEEGDTKMDG
ncbi:hypothetical protein FRC04_012228 [Tulasnella sp. 424]|nr:hypothetical protein FRC04_012228 [Tulasnella sp. 424]KAG8973713.1 hypothetical protein FRC05_008301 [Tulasnella sp. 425]